MKKKIVILSVLILFVFSFQQAHAKSYWLEGGGIGAGILGVGLGLTAWRVCESFKEEDEVKSVSRCNSIAIPLGVVAGGGIGFGIGAAIGTTYKKKQPAITAIIDPTTGTYGASVGMEF